MDPRLAQHMRGRFDRLANLIPTLRVGQVTDESPLSVSLGDGDPYTSGVKSITQVAVGDIVAALQAGRRPPVILGALRDGGPAFTYGTSFPPTPVDGHVHIYPYGSGVLWPFRYNAGSASAYKWEALGPSPAGVYGIGDAGSTAATNTSYAQLGGAGTHYGRITVPFAGDYRSRMECLILSGSGVSSFITQAPSSPSDNEALVEDITEDFEAVARTRRFTGLASGANIDVWARGSTATGYFWRNLSHEVWPLRVSG